MTTPARRAVLSIFMATVALFCAPVSASADQWQPLRDDPEIHQGLTVIAVGRHIDTVCPDIDARLFRALAFAESLVSRAMSLGFSRSEVNGYIDSRADQDRYREIARQYMTQRGYDITQMESVCQVGRDEIAAQSAIGRLLRER